MNATQPTVTIVFLVFNRREELRLSLEEMAKSDYPADLVDVIVVDNGSEDGSSEMVRTDFPDVQLITRAENCGVSGWNDGLAAATGEWVLLLDDDCYLPPDGLRRAIEHAREHQADLVSFGVTSSERPTHRFDYEYRTGLLAFWGCAVLVRNEVLADIGGYDPEIFVWANEVEFMLRFLDAGYRHLHAPEIIAVHMRNMNRRWVEYVGTPGYQMNNRNLAYTAGKHLHARQAAGALMAILATHVRDSLRANPGGLKAIPTSIAGFRNGLRHRKPVSHPDLSDIYRRHFISWASPWWLSRPPHLFLAELPGAAIRRVTGRRRPAAHPGRRGPYYERAARYYPTQSGTLQLK